MSNGNNLQDKLNAAFKAYSSALPEKIVEISTCWNKLLKEWDHWVFEDFKRSIHSLHGSGSIYGYTDMSLIAGQIEKILNHSSDAKNTSDEDKALINILLEDLKKSSLKPNKITQLPSQSIMKDEDNNHIYIVNLGYQIDNSNLIWANDLTNQLKVFNYVAHYVTTIQDLEVAVKDKLPLALLININILDNADRDKLFSYHKQHLQQIPLIYFGTNSDFSTRLKVVKSDGQAYLVKPFTIDELIYELDKILSIKNEVYRVLIIDDEIESANYFSILINNSGIETMVIHHANVIDEALHKFKPDLILLDIYMPECNGNELASIIRQQRLYEFIPIVYLSCEENVLRQAEMLAYGADDFISKKSDSDYVIKIIKNKARRYKLLNSISTKDNLTVADNIDSVNLKLEADLKRSLLESQVLTVAIIEVSGMEKINMSYGYNAGDQVLKNLALLLRNRTRVTDTIGRYSENKFIVILPNRDLAAAKQLINDLQKHFLSLNYYYNNQLFNASFNAGLAASTEYTEPAKLIKAADEELANHPI